VLDRIRVLVLDVDGVLTDGRIIYDSTGGEIKTFHVQDGQAVKYWLRAGHGAAIVSGRTSPITARRAQELGIERVYEGAKAKLPAFEQALRDLGCEASEVCALGDDLPDIPVLARAGFAVAVADAAPEVRRLAHYVTRRPGGAGAVRETVELVLKHQGRWADVCRRYADQVPPGLPHARHPWRAGP
jgi:3-deoxy-D-manno-octulosonate 8-phosphate phosphatase (KDO 8-P phosphatase)